MTKTEFVEYLAAKNDIAKTEAAREVTRVIEGLADALKEGKSVELIGFGKFDVIEKPEHESRNPSTGEKVVVPAHKAAHFKYSAALQKTIKD